MTTLEIDNERNGRGVFSTGNDVAGWYALSRDGINQITFYQGKYTFSVNDNVTRRYTKKGFAKRITQLLNRGY